MSAVEFAEDFIDHVTNHIQSLIDSGAEDISADDCLIINIGTDAASFMSRIVALSDISWAGIFSRQMDEGIAAARSVEVEVVHLHVPLVSFPDFCIALRSGSLKLDLQDPSLGQMSASQTIH